MAHQKSTPVIAFKGARTEDPIERERRLTPGPGAYAPPRVDQKLYDRGRPGKPGIGRAVRFPRSLSTTALGHATPGPGAYDPPAVIGNPQFSKSYSLGRRTERRTGDAGKKVGSERDESPSPVTYCPPPQGIHSQPTGKGWYRHGPAATITQRRSLRATTGVSTEMIRSEPGPGTYNAKSIYWDGRSALGKSRSGSSFLIR